MHCNGARYAAIFFVSTYSSVYNLLSFGIQKRMIGSDMPSIEDGPSLALLIPLLRTLFLCNGQRAFDWSRKWIGMILGFVGMLNLIVKTTPLR